MPHAQVGKLNHMHRWYVHAHACTCMHMHAHAQVGKLNHIISEADAGRLRQKRDYDLVINERDILGTQVRLYIYI